MRPANWHWRWGSYRLFRPSAPGWTLGSMTRELYKRRNEIERLFRRLKGFRRIFSRFEKLDTLFLGFILFALIFDALH